VLPFRDLDHWTAIAESHSELRLKPEFIRKKRQEIIDRFATVIEEHDEAVEPDDVPCSTIALENVD